MQVILNSTTKVVSLDGVPARIWEGKTDSGIEVHAFIMRISVGKDEDHRQFERELMECQPPTDIVERAYPLSLIL